MMSTFISVLWVIGILVLSYPIALLVSLVSGPIMTYISAQIGWHQPQTVRNCFGFMEMLTVSLIYAAGVVHYSHYISPHTIFWIIWLALWIAAVMPPFIAQMGRADFERNQGLEYHSNYYYLHLATTLITAICFVLFSINHSSMSWLILLVFGCTMGLLLYIVITEPFQRKMAIIRDSTSSPKKNQDYTESVNNSDPNFVPPQPSSDDWNEANQNIWRDHMALPPVPNPPADS